MSRVKNRKGRSKVSMGEAASMSRVKNRKGRSKVSMGEAASRVVVQVYHTGQGQDERTEASRPRPHAPWPLSGLDAAWSGASNPHRESGTRWRAAADVGLAGMCAGTAHGQQKGRDGNRLGDSVGAHAPCTGEGPRSAVRTQRGVTGRRGLDSGRTFGVGELSGFKRVSLIVGVTH